MPFTFSNHQYVNNVHNACAHGGCQYNMAIGALTAAQQLVDQSKKGTAVPTQSLWCEREGLQHSFSSKKGYAQVDRRIFDGQGNIIRHDDLTMCIGHAEDAGLVPKDEGINEIASLDSGTVGNYDPLS